MRLWPAYTTVWGRFWDAFAGAITALIVNAAILWVEELHIVEDAHSILPWLVNGLFVLVFFIILPYFSLGYLVAAAFPMAASLLSSVLLLAGCFLILGLAAVYNALAVLFGALGPTDTSLPLESPSLALVGIAVLIFVALLLGIGALIFAVVRAVIRGVRGDDGEGLII